ncbi:Extracellular matrix-binding ebh [Babesia ovata]|uniref:Extracellular matrix-binding ebh n=1 Tax=Babesia ovata TaxID=189622 RepID=A0A2H6KJ21_9APIC|nr:Extracellular matrix-binding ebh [Babesia ovata]GBE62992.1 Extracellular matrix-binding ebh [Babesia ovata]
MMQPTRCFVISLLRLSPCRHSLNALLHPSFQWIEAADAAVKAAKEKAEDVHGRLDHNKNDASGTVIGQGIGKIEEAQKQVSQVDKKLSQHIDELGTWKSAAHSVLSTAVEKAEEVRGKLNPDGKDPIGHNIEKIHTSNEAIKKANSQLKSQVESLHSWITTAEGIRQKAQKKAEEAYKKLKPHEALSKKIGEIMDANKKIKDVHTELGKVHNNLGMWNQQAKKVLDGAIDNATTVYNGLNDGHAVMNKIGEIDSARQQIVTANSQLASEVDNLGKWKTAAGSVIDKADGKCEEILKKVKAEKDGKSDTIFEYANEMSEKGVELFRAASEAKSLVEQKVTEALEAVVAMDKSLKTDLKKVKDDIKIGIDHVIKTLQVKELDTLVKNDLKTLREKIEKLNNGDELVTDNLAALAETKKSTLDEKAEAIKTSESQLEGKFKQEIQSPLSTKVKAVDQAIERLGGKFNKGGTFNSIQEIFGHIKDKVGEIKGTAGNGSWDNSGGSGLDGIKSAVNTYYNAFSGEYNFEKIVNGWLQGILGKREKRVVEWFKEWTDDHVTDGRPTGKRVLGNDITFDKIFRDKIIDHLKKQLHGEAKAAGGVVGQGKSTDNITANIEAVKKGCEDFVKRIDAKLMKGQISTLLQAVRGKVVGKIVKLKKGKDEDIDEVLKTILVALRSTSNQVSEELNSVFLNIPPDISNGDPSPGSIASILDKITPVANKLHENLEAATQQQPPGLGASGQNESPAQAVDKRLNAVRQEVTQLEENFKKAKQNLEAEVAKLPDAVEAFNKSAEEQIKAAANTAIQKAAAQISDNGDPNTIDLSTKMPTFNSHFTAITKNLESKLKQQVDKHIGEDDPPGQPSGPAAEKVKLPEEHFKQYQAYVDASGVSDPTRPDELKKLTGQLPVAINSISSEGLQKLTELIDGKGGKAQITTNTFEEPFGKITTELNEIAGLVDGERSDSSFMEGDPNEGIKDFLRNLTSMLRNAFFVNGKKGLHEITKAIEGLHKTPFTTHPKAIDTAVTAIKEELRKLRGKLKKEPSGGQDNDVIDDLSEMLSNGLGTGKGKWPTKGSSNLDGLGSIAEELQAQNGKLPGQTKIIGDATQSIINDITTLLSNVKMKLGHNIIPNNDIAYYMGQLQKKLGKDVSKQDDDTLQPGKISVGVSQIENELTKLRDRFLKTDNGATRETDKGVLNNLADVIKEISKDSEASGLSKIKKEIAELNTATVPKVTDYLNKLCNAVTNHAGNAGWHLGQLEERHINEGLKGIENDINTLSTDDLQEAIEMCDKFLTDADEIERNTVKGLEKFVDYEVNDAIEELTKEARQDYVESAKDALKHFALKAESELGELPGEINRDLFVGYKGLMKQMEGERSENINRLRNVQSRMLRALSSAFQNFFAPLDEHLREEIERVKKQSDDEKNPSLPKSEEPYAAEWDAVHSDVNALLNYLCVTQGFDDRLRGLLHNLTDALTQLRPQGFQKPSTPTLDSVSRGLSAFVGEFGGAYISTYSGAECREADADKYAKVLLSIIPMTHEALSNLAEKCGNNWRSYKICKLTGDDRDNGLGNYLTKCGFKVSPTDGLQVGELQNRFSGGAVHELLASPVADVTTKMLVGGKPAENGINVVDLVALFYNMLCRYLQVCHLKVHESPRYPCTVRDMLSWLSGLQYTPVADKLPDHCRALLNRKCDDNDAPNREDKVMVQCINGLPFTIAEACSYANSLLVTIQGRGRGFDLAAYPYSVDFANNTAQLYYPDDPDELLDMLRGIVCRLCSVLYFLYAQCCRTTATTKGWRECHYGRQVPSSHWQCNTFDRQATDASHNCPPTSPLQSFLTDSCPSLLPHKLSVVDNAIECANCPSNQPGQQCLTPLGFWDLGLAASVARTGKDLAKSLGRLCSDADACLFQLCRTLRLLCPSAPQSLGDVFALFFQMLRVWDHESSRRAYSHHESYLTHLNGDAINSLFPLWPQLHGSYRNANLTDALKALAGHDHDNSGHNALSSLSAEPPCQSPSGCAPFLQPLALHANHTFPQKHAQLYVSWIVWLAWQLWELLESLLDALNNIDCTAHGCATCLCQPSNHNDKDSCHCPSLVECGGPLPTLYRYGFTYRNAHALLAGSQKIRCSDLNDQLTKALHSDHFTQLFHQIDQLLYTIRMPFLFAITALWLIATLFIAHSLLYRMDVLRIRSHLLTTRASHLIYVKALLAGSRRMLSLYKDVDYFDDDFHS